MIDVAPLERTELQARLDNAIVLMIRAHVGKPCPTRREIMEWTGIPRRQVWEVLGEIAARGLIELEVYDPDPTRQEMPKRRRMRVARGKWTDWTARAPFCKGGHTPKNPPPVGYATGGDRHHGRRVLTEDEAQAVYRDKRKRALVAESYGISISEVDAIRARRSWPWLNRQ